MKILLATPPAGGSELGAGTPPPLGLFYAATAAKENFGDKVKIIDPFAEGLFVEEATARVLAHSPVSPVGLTDRRL